MMPHLAPDELLGYAHGWLDDPENAIAQAHVESCGECAATVAELSTEREMLHEAADAPFKEDPMTALAIPMPAARPHVPARPGGLSITIAAAVLGAFAVGFLVRDARIVAPPPPQQEIAGESAAARIRRLVRDFVGADAMKAKVAKAELLKTGRPAIRILIQERRALPFEKFRLVSDLLLTIKFQGDRSEAAMNFRRLVAHVRVETGGAWGITSAGLSTQLFQDFQVLYDGPAIADSNVTLPEGLGHKPFRYELVDVCLNELDLDYAVRFGRIIVSTPDRLWPYPATSTRKLPEKEVDGFLKGLDAESIDARDDAMRAVLAVDADLADTLRARRPSASANQQAHLDRILEQISRRVGRPALDDACTMDTQKPGDKAVATFEQLQRELPWGRFPVVEKSGGGAVFTVESEGSNPLPEWSGLRLDLTLMKLQDGVGTRLLCPEMLADSRLTTFVLSGEFPLAKTTGREALVLVSRLSGTDFCYRDGDEPSIWFDTPEEIRKLQK